MRITFENNSLICAYCCCCFVEVLYVYIVCSAKFRCIGIITLFSLDEVYVLM
jgi:hypothetical protein